MYRVIFYFGVGFFFVCVWVGGVNPLAIRYPVDPDHSSHVQ